MEIAQISVNRNALQITRHCSVTRGMVGASVVFGPFSPEWKGLAKTAVFRGRITRDVVNVLEGEPVVIPWEVVDTVASDLEVGICGHNEEGTLVIPTVWGSLRRIEAGALPEGQPGEPPTPTWTQQVEGRVQQALEEIQAVRPMLQDAAEAAAAAASSQASAVESAGRAEEAASIADQAVEAMGVSLQSGRAAASAAAGDAGRAEQAASDAGSSAASASASAEAAAAKAQTAAAAARAATGQAEEAASQAVRAKQEADRATREADKNGWDQVVYEYELTEDVSSITNSNLWQKLLDPDRIELVFYGALQKNVKFTLYGLVQAAGQSLGAFYGQPQTIQDDNPRQWSITLEKMAPNAIRAIAGTNFAYDVDAPDGLSGMSNKMCWLPGKPLSQNADMFGFILRINGGMFLKGGTVRYTLYKRRGE